VKEVEIDLDKIKTRYKAVKKLDLNNDDFQELFYKDLPKIFNEFINIKEQNKKLKWMIKIEQEEARKYKNQLEKPKPVSVVTPQPTPQPKPQPPIPELKKEIPQVVKPSGSPVERYP